jgi:hypothetical protein
VSYDGGIHLGNGGVVKEHPVLPVTPLVAIAGITESVVDSAVVPHLRAPISRMPKIATTIITPITGSPN